MGVSDAAGHAEERAVAAEDENHVHLAGQQVFLDHFHVSGRAQRLCQRRGRGIEYRLDLTRLEPVRHLDEVLGGGLKASLRDDTDPACHC